MSGAAGSRTSRRWVCPFGSTATSIQKLLPSMAIHELLDAVLSVEEVGGYKPDSAVYRYAVERLGIPPEQICFPERLPGRPDREIRTLADLPELVGAATGR
jgi:2-haloacid dehalogenase